MSIELQVRTGSTQKLKLIEKGEQFTYTPLLTCRLSQTANVEFGVRCNYIISCVCQDSKSRPLALIPYWVACTINSTWKLQLIGKNWQFTYTPTMSIFLAFWYGWSQSFPYIFFLLNWKNQIKDKHNVFSSLTFSVLWKHL
jgi:hypothetical protein